MGLNLKGQFLVIQIVLLIFSCLANATSPETPKTLTFSQTKLGSTFTCAHEALTLAYKNIGIEEYAPRKIKQSVTGNGNASKEQVAGMVESILKTKIESKFMDATDGLAVALCHHYQDNALLKGGGSKNWASFIKNNPGRIQG